MWRCAFFALLLPGLARGDSTTSSAAASTATGSATASAPSTPTVTTTTAAPTTTSTGTVTAPVPDIAGLTARAQAGDAKSAVDLSLAYYNGNGVPKDWRKSFDLSLEGAIQGDIGGERNLGVAYGRGIGVHPNMAKCLAWYLKAARQGDPDSQMYYAKFNQFGVGCAVNAVEARKWMEKAAQQGQAEAEARYGDMLVYGIGGPVDVKQGIAYYMRAANNFPAARYILAKCYAQGVYFPRDLMRAYAWCLTASGTTPDPKLADLPAKIESSLTIDQMAKATQLAPSLLKLSRLGPDQPAELASSFTSGNSVTLKFREWVGYIILTLTLQDKEPHDFLVDTGCPSSLLDAKLASRFGYVAADPFPVTGVGPDLGLMTSATGVTLSAPGLRITGARLSLMDDFEFDRYLGRPIAGFIGTDLLRPFVVHIDYHAHTLTLTRPGKAAPEPKAAELPMRVLLNVPFVPAAVSSGTVTGKTDYFLLDTGDRGSLSVGLGYQADNPDLALHAITSISSVGFGGVSHTGMGRANLTIGPRVNKDVNTSIVQNRVGSAATGPLITGDIGQAVWSRFNLTLDYPAGKIRFSPNVYFGKPFSNVEDGAGIWTAPNDYHTFLIFDVDADSPAAHAGLKVGDQLLSLDGKPTTGRDLEQIYDVLRVVGPHHFKVRRDGADLTLLIPTYDPLAHPEQIAQYKTTTDDHPPGTKIAALAVRWEGPAPYPDAVILRASGLQVGDAYLQGTSNRALKQLYATEVLDDVLLRADNSPDGLKVTIVAKPRPLVKTVTLTGLTPQEEALLRPKLIAEEGRRESDYDLFQDAETIRRQLIATNSPPRTVYLHVLNEDWTILQREISISKPTP
jgi:membrane-associated protease RseP (regulator of RpoE activity)